MRTSNPSAGPAHVLVLILAIALPFAVAETSERLAEARAGATAGSLAVFLEFIVDHDTTYFGEDAVYHVMALPEPLRGLEAISEFFAAMEDGAFVDTHVEVRTVVADGTRVVLEFAYTGTDPGEPMAQPPTGQHVSVPILGTFEIDGQYIHTGPMYYDTATATMRPLTALTRDQLHRARAECQAWHDLALPGPTIC